MLFNSIGIPTYWIWVILVILFSIIEGLTFGLVTIWFAIAAVIMVFFSLLKINFVAQIFIFLGISTVLLIFTRPLAVKKFKSGKEKTNVESLAGKQVLVTKKITEFERGEVKLNGVIWSAKSLNNSSIDEGVKCEVVRVEGVQLIVKVLENAVETKNNLSEV